MQSKRIVVSEDFLLTRLCSSSWEKNTCPSFQPTEALNSSRWEGEEKSLDVSLSYVTVREEKLSGNV